MRFVSFSFENVLLGRKKDIIFATTIEVP